MKHPGKGKKRKVQIAQEGRRRRWVKDRGVHQASSRFLGKLDAAWYTGRKRAKRKIRK